MVALSVGACGVGPSISGSGSMFGGSSSMSADDVGAYCKYSAQLYNPVTVKDSGTASPTDTLTAAATVSSSATCVKVVMW